MIAHADVRDFNFRHECAVPHRSTSESEGEGVCNLDLPAKKRFVGDYRQCPYCAALIRIQLPRRFMPEQITEAFAIEILRNTDNCQTGHVSLSIRAGSERLLCLNSTSRYTVTL